MSQSIAKKKYDYEYYSRTSNKKNSHKRWKDWEIFMILGGDQPDSTLSTILERSIKSIQLKRSRYIKEWFPDYETQNGIKSVIAKEDMI